MRGFYHLIGNIDFLLGIFMNQTIQVLNAHRSERGFTDEPVIEEQLSQIISAAHLAPTSINGQQVSVIVVKDVNRREEIAKIAGGQPWIAKAPIFLAFVVDYYKTNLAVEKTGQKQMMHESVEALVVGGIDVGIALGRAMVAAQSLGLGIVPIGGIRRDPEAMIKLLELPPMTFPVAGMCIGHIDKHAEQKPRLPLPSFRHEEVYHRAELRSMIDAYDLTLVQHWKKIGRAEGESWSQSIATPYSKIYFPLVRPLLEKQSFGLAK